MRFSFSAAFALLPVMFAGLAQAAPTAPEPPTEWIDAQTGHRVLRDRTAAKIDDVTPRPPP